MPLLHRNHSHTIPYCDIRYIFFLFLAKCPCDFSRATLTYFHRLDEDVVVLRGGPTESAGALLKGRLAFCLSETIPVRSITLTLVGTKRLQYAAGSLISVEESTRS